MTLSFGAVQGAAGGGAVAVLVDDFTFGFAPIGVAVTPSGGHVYVTNRGSDTISVIDSTLDAVITTIPVEDRPMSVAVAPGGAHVFVTDEGSNTVSLIDTATSTVVATIQVDNSPVGVAITPGGGHAYVTNLLSDTASVIDTATKVVTRSSSVAVAAHGGWRWPRAGATST